MPTNIIFNDDRKDSRATLQVDEDPAQVAAALAKNPMPQLTAKGSPVWVSATSVRLLRPQRRGGRPAGGGGGRGGADKAKAAGGGEKPGDGES
jgi:hypothetical protein